MNDRKLAASPVASDDGTGPSTPAADDAPHGLLHALVLDGAGGARALPLDALRDWTPVDGVLWLHLDYTTPLAAELLGAHTEAGSVVFEQLLAEESRPRATPLGDEALIALRGVNLHPDADPEDMVAIRLWAGASRVVSTRRRRLLSVTDIVGELAAGRGPRNAGGIVVALAERLTERMQDTIDALDERVADLESEVLSEPAAGARQGLTAVRRASILLRRYLAPQREALAALGNARPSWLDDHQRVRLREVLDRLIRHIEDLDATRERAAVTQEELANRHAELLNGRLYLLALVSAVFLPLGFLTGLMGVNLGGIPGAASAWGFAVFVALVGLVALGLLIWFRRRRWL